MWIKKEEFKKLKKQAEHYKDLTGTFLIEINEKGAEIKKLEEKIKRLEAQIAKDTSNQTKE